MRRKSWFRCTVAGALLALVASMADAAHFTTHLDALDAAVAARITEIGTPGTGALKAELGHLKAMQKSLAKTTTKLSADLGALTAALGRLRKIAAPDADVAAAVTPAVGAFTADVDGLGDAVAAAVQAYEQGGGKKSVVRSLKKLLDAAARSLDRAAAAPDSVKRSSLLRSAAKSLEKARALLDKTLCAGGGSMTCDVGETTIVHRPFEGAFAIRRKTSGGTLVNLYIHPTGTTGHVDLYLEAFQVAPGTYAASSIARYFEGAKQYDPTSGTVTITAVDLTREFIAGTFEFTGAEFFDPQDTRTITSGRFTICKFNEQVLID